MRCTLSDNAPTGSRAAVHHSLQSQSLEGALTTARVQCGLLRPCPSCRYTSGSYHALEARASGSMLHPSSFETAAPLVPVHRGSASTFHSPASIRFAEVYESPYGSPLPADAERQPSIGAGIIRRVSSLRKSGLCTLR